MLNKYSFIINVEEFNIKVKLKNIKNIYIRILLDGEIKISAPIYSNKNLLISLCKSKIKWLRLKLSKINQTINSKEIIINHNIYLWGKKYNINYFKNKLIVEKLSINKLEDLNKAIKNLYINQIKQETFKILNFWEKKIGVKPNKISFQWMKSKWGCCNPSSKHIKINTELARMPKKFLEYILVHELIHLIEANHGTNFKKLMNNNIPNWKILRKQLRNYLT